MLSFVANEVEANHARQLTGCPGCRKRLDILLSYVRNMANREQLPDVNSSHEFPIVSMNRPIFQTVLKVYF